MCIYTPPAAAIAVTDLVWFGFVNTDGPWSVSNAQSEHFRLIYLGLYGHVSKVVFSGSEVGCQSFQLTKKSRKIKLQIFFSISFQGWYFCA